MQGRSEGIHVSHVIHDLCIRLGHYEDRGKDSGPDMSRMQLGCALEHAIVHRYALDSPGRYVQPGELELDNLFGTPDLYDTEDDAIHEIKLTWSSSRNEVGSKKLWRYWRQLECYCKMIGTRVGRLHVGFVNGDYKFTGPEMYVWERRYEQEELDKNWEMITKHARRLRDGDE